MKQFYTQITYVNDTLGHTNHVEGICPTDAKNLSDLYAEVRKHFKGRVTKMYLETKNNEPVHVGYCVTRKQKYEDCDETYVETVWIEFLEPVQVVETVTKYRAVGVV